MINTNNIDVLNLYIQGAKDRLLKYSPQLYLLNGSFPVPYASSILIKVKTKYFLVTAAHVLEGAGPGEIKIGHNEVFITLSNNWHYLEDVNLDLAVMEVNGDLQEAICKNYNFYDLGAINPDHQIGLDQYFFTFGYPATKTKVVQKLKKIKVNALAYSTNLQTIRKCQEMGFHPNVHLILSLNKKVKSAISGNVVQSPDQPGMSGSGIWHIPSSYMNPKMEDIPLILSGIYIEFHKQHSSIVATRTLILTEFLKRNFDCDLHSTKRVRIGE